MHGFSTLLAHSNAAAARNISVAELVGISPPPAEALGEALIVPASTPPRRPRLRPSVGEAAATAVVVLL